MIICSIPIESLFQVASEKDKEILEKFHESNIEFYLTGSFSFGTYRNGSDFDFFVDYKYVNEVQKISELKFTGMSLKELYTDVNTRTVAKTWEGNIHIQFVQQISVKIEAQKRMEKIANVLKDTGFVGIFDLEVRTFLKNHNVWRALMKALIEEDNNQKEIQKGNGAEIEWNKGMVGEQKEKG